MDRMVPTFDLEFIELKLVSLLSLGGRLPAAGGRCARENAAQLVSVERSTRERFQRIACAQLCED